MPQISQEMIFGAGLFATVAILAYAISGMVFHKDPVAKRLRRQHDDELSRDRFGLTGGGGGASARGNADMPGAGGGTGGMIDNLTHSGGAAAVVPVMERMSAAVAKPFMPKSAAKQSNLRKQLMHAGIYSAQAMELVVGMKVVLLGVGAVMGYLIGAAIGGVAMYMFLYIGGLLGFFAPTLWLKRKIKQRRRRLDSSLPDALDLMVVCVESGLTLDAALQRVGSEIALAHPDISKELGITHMETRVGLSRIDALRNLGQRTGSASLQSLAAMLVQTERFGTSIAQALRVHGESLRVKRRYAAEEQAAKTTVKLAFPVVLFIFPTLLVVLGGPAFILFFKSPLFNK
jgi:tight adherence protein C